MSADKTMPDQPESASVTRTGHTEHQVVRRTLTDFAVKHWRVVLIGLLCFVNAYPAMAAMTDAQKRMTNNLKTAVDNAADLFKQKKFSDAANELKRAQKILDALNKKPDAAVLKQIDKTYRRMKKAHELLLSNGQTLEPLKDLPAPPPPSAKKETEDSDEENKEEESDEESQDEDAEERERKETRERSSRKSTSRTKTAKKVAKSKEEDVEEISFTSVVAPILVEHCGRCHIDGNRGEYSLASYQTLMDGSSIVAKEPDSSTMLQMIESGDMPPKRGGRGEPVPEEDAKKIRDWITQGARFDGADAEANLKEL